MKKLLMGGATAALLIASAPALAQAAPPPGVAQGTAPALPAPLPPQMHPQMHMQMMSGRVMTRNEVVGHVRKLFAHLDTNRDGFITRNEIEALHQGMMMQHAGVPMPMDNPAAMFDRIDSNHDGVISRQEFAAAHSQMRERRVVIMRDGGASGSMPGAPGMEGMKMHMHGGMGMGMGGHLFEMADANHDGRVSLQEAEAAALAHFDRADLNHDGKLTPEERRQAHQLMRGERRRG
jgi:hypothetical protein